MKNRLMPLWDKIMLRKRYVIECINDTLKNIETLVHSRHRSINNYIMNLISTLAAYCFYGNKPRALSGFEVATTNQLSLYKSEKQQNKKGGQMTTFCTRGGYRTHTSLRTADFESTASTIPPPGQGDSLFRNRVQKYYFFCT